MSCRTVAAAVLLTGLWLALAGCASREAERERPYDAANEVYWVDSGDRLRITVFGQPDLSGEFAVSDAGTVAVPLIEPIYVRGLSVREVQEAVAEELGKNLLRNPSVGTEIAAFRPFFILGEVEHAGQYPFVSGMTVQTAVAIAGGFTYRARESSVRITRRRGDMLVELSADVGAAVLPGDTILVEERYF